MRAYLWVVWAVAWRRWRGGDQGPSERPPQTCPLLPRTAAPACPAAAGGTGRRHPPCAGVSVLVQQRAKEQVKRAVRQWSRCLQRSCFSAYRHCKETAGMGWGGRGPASSFWRLAAERVPAYCPPPTSGMCRPPVLLAMDRTLFIALPLSTPLHAMLRSRCRAEERRIGGGGGGGRRYTRC